MRRLGPTLLVAALALGACSSGDDASTATTAVPPAPTSSRPAATPAPVTTVAPGTSLASGSDRPSGFSAVSVRVVPPGGADVLTWCLWLAATAAERERGLMGVTSLGGADGMLFDFGGTTTGEFWMFQTLLPLSIAFYDESGAFVSSADMDPCTSTDTSRCARYGADGPYARAVEVAQGDLGRLGLVAGSRLEVGEACTPG